MSELLNGFWFFILFRSTNKMNGLVKINSMKIASQPASQEFRMLEVVEIHHDTFWPFELLV